VGQYGIWEICRWVKIMVLKRPSIGPHLGASYWPLLLVSVTSILQCTYVQFVTFSSLYLSIDCSSWWRYWACDLVIQHDSGRDVVRSGNEDSCIETGCLCVSCQGQSLFTQQQHPTARNSCRSVRYACWFLMCTCKHRLSDKNLVPYSIRVVPSGQNY